MYNLKDIENKIIYGDCLDEMKKIPDESVDLIYLDPPFFSGRNYELPWGDEFEVAGFCDTWKKEGGRVGDIEFYKDFMKDRLKECHRVLKQTGTIFLHCDKHANHHLRLLLDEIFGENKFLNEIIWCYTRHANIGGMFPSTHDNIYWYAKGNKWIFNSIKEVTTNQKKKFKQGYQLGGQKDAIIIYDRTNPKTKEALKKYPNHKIIESDMKGKQIPDYWEIPMLNPMAKERLGYPTQKPEALLERIILASSNEENIILDPFCGCGTTLAVAKKNNRRYIGMDISWKACKLMTDRLNKINPENDHTYYDVINWKRTKDDFEKMEWIVFQDSVCDAIGAVSNPKKVADDGIDGTFIDDTLIQVKQWKNAVGNREVQRMSGILGTHKKKNGKYPVGVIIAFKFSKKAEEERIKAKNSEGKFIVLLSVDDIVNNDLSKLKDAEVKRFDRGLLGKTWD